LDEPSVFNRRSKMNRILTRAELEDNYSPSIIAEATQTLRGITDDDLDTWQLREQCRMGGRLYTPITILGDNHMRFLHEALDAPDMVAYTKCAGKGEVDIQTRTTLAAYCTKYGLAEPSTTHEADRLGAARDDASAIEGAYDDLVSKVTDYFTAVDIVTALKKELREML